MSNQPTFHEAWLVELVTERFESYAERPSQNVLDELYVLIGTLKIAGFATAHQLMKVRLQEVRASETASPAIATTPAPKRDREVVPEETTEPPKDLAGFLRHRVRGQDRAIAVVSDRLSLARSGLRLRPERPAAVMLFAGPTGVGKTELARQLAIGMYGSARSLIRLDMSEYGEYEFGLSRLIGVGQGYVGQNEPEGWLTTRVTARPRSTILLDEVEKADWRIWNTFLQVFDAGRLTDGRGHTADFSQATIILTSNLGSREASRRTAGFGESGDSAGARRKEAITGSFAPELLNRLDDLVLFEPLSLDAIRQIAQSQLDLFLKKITAQGFSVHLGPDVVSWLAETGYDPNFGARHLQRTIETQLLVPLAASQLRLARVEVGETGLVIEPMEAGRVEIGPSSRRDGGALGCRTPRTPDNRRP